MEYSKCFVTYYYKYLSIIILQLNARLYSNFTYVHFCKVYFCTLRDSLFFIDITPILKVSSNGL